MIPARAVCPVKSVYWVLAALSVLGIACSSDSSTSSASGGTQGSGGASSRGGTIAGGGTVGSGGAAGQAGSKASGGTSAGGSPSQGGATAGSGPSETGGAGAGGTSGKGGATTSSGTAQSGTGGASASGGRTGTASAGTGGGQSGSAGAGGTSTGTGSTGVATASGGTQGGGAAGTGGAGSGGSTGTDAVKSAGCGKARTLQNGTLTIQSNGSRKYILKVPDSYDSNTPYRLVLAYAESGASATQVASRNYFTLATLDSKNTIFVAPDAANGAGSWSNTDVAFTDAILTQLEGDLCIDKTRVFATGFSFGAGMAMALACTRADVFRAVAFFSGADLTSSCPTTLTKPIAYYASQASEDANGMSPTSPMTGEMKQAQFAALNGCTAETASTTFPAAGKPHTCTIYKGCSAGHPTEYCVFNGPHGWEPKDPGQTSSWDAPEAWKFIAQF